jgi:C1A family cysteine protease
MERFMAALQFHPGGYRDEPDARDRRFVPKLERLPQRADLSQFCGKVYQQYRIQSCSANALASAMTLIANQLDEAIAPPSRLFMYYNARALSNAQRKDCGTTIRLAIKALARQGACPERQWPYRKDAVTLRPLRACYADAQIRPIRYHRIAQELDLLHAALAQGSAFVFGIQAYGDTFTQAARTAYLRLPRKTDTPLGGHALIAVGYDATKKTFIARNSLGSAFAKNGFFSIPDAYFTNPELTYDFWTIGGKTGW